MQRVKHILGRVSDGLGGAIDPRWDDDNARSFARPTAAAGRPTDRPAGRARRPLAAARDDGQPLALVPPTAGRPLAPEFSGLAAQLHAKRAAQQANLAQTAQANAHNKRAFCDLMAEVARDPLVLQIQQAIAEGMTTEQEFWLDCGLLLNVLGVQAVIDGQQRRRTLEEVEQAPADAFRIDSPTAAHVGNHADASGRVCRRLKEIFAEIMQGS